MGAYWPSPWPAEDGGAERRQVARGLPALAGATFDVRTREVPAATMVVVRDPGEVYLLRHTGGDDAISWVERLDPETLEPIERSPDLAGGPTWPGGLACHADGSLHAVFGNHAHRLAADCSVLASRTLPRVRPYNSFVVLDDGTLVVKDFHGSRPGAHVEAADREPCELVALDPVTLEDRARLVLPEASIARLSAADGVVSVVGDTSLLRVAWDGGGFSLADPIPYRTLDGQTYGWDCVLSTDGTTWFLDDGDGSEAYTGTLRGHGRSGCPLHLVRISAGGEVAMVEVSGLPGGLVANPPVVDEERRVVVAYDSGNGVVVGVDADTLAIRWRRDQDHGCHPILLADAGEVLTHDFHDGSEDLVVLDVLTGAEVARVATGSPVQSVLFPAVGWEGELWSVSFLTVARVRPLATA